MAGAVAAVVPAGGVALLELEGQTARRLVETGQAQGAGVVGQSPSAQAAVGVELEGRRRDPEDLRVGDALDFWRVEAVEPNRSIRLRAEMKVPGRAWLEFRSVAQPDGVTLLTQTAFFEPKGLLGLLYWYTLYPVHSLIFSGLIRKIASEAARPSGVSKPTPRFAKAS